MSTVVTNQSFSDGEGVGLCVFPFGVVGGGVISTGDLARRLL